MAALDFPNTPAVNDTWTAPTGAVYKWDGTVWVIVPSTTSGIPEAPTDGALYGRGGTTPAWAKVLPLGGGTLSGPLSLAADPTVALGAATKQYVDTKYLALAGGTLTGPLLLAADPTGALGAATKQYVDNRVTSASYLPIIGGTLTGPLLLAADPTSTLEATTKQYVDQHDMWTLNAPTSEIWSLNSGTYDLKCGRIRTTTPAAPASFNLDFTGSVVNTITFGQLTMQNNGGVGVNLLGVATENWSAGARGSKLQVRTVSTGGTQQYDRIVLDGSNFTYIPSAGVRLGALGDATQPREQLDVQGAVIVAGATNASPVNGTLQYSSNHVQGRVAGAWVNLDASNIIADDRTQATVTGATATATQVGPDIAIALAAGKALRVRAGGTVNCSAGSSNWTFQAFIGATKIYDSQNTGAASTAPITWSFDATLQYMDATHVRVSAHFWYAYPPALGDVRAGGNATSQQIEDTITVADAAQPLKLYSLFGTAFAGNTCMRNRVLTTWT